MLKELLDKKIKDQIQRLKGEVAQLETHTALQTDCGVVEDILHHINVRVGTLRQLVANREKAGL